MSHSMGSGNPLNPLDSLMMAYADLSGGNKGSSFKGPPLKEVKVTKQAAPAFTPSSKARDWTSLEQALEDAFVSAPAPQVELVPVQPHLSPGFQVWEPPPQHPAPPVVATDDWGDFQDFQTSDLKPNASKLLKSSTDDDDFADFVTAVVPQPSVVTNSSLSNTVGLRLASFQEESPVHNFRGPKIEPIRLNDSPSRFDAFFGAEDDYHASNHHATVPVDPVSLNVEAFSPPNLNPMSILPTPITVTNDKYGALAEIFSLSDPVAPATLNTQPKVEPQIPDSGFSGKTGALPLDLFSMNLNQNQNQVSGQPASQIEEEEDFGDFITVSGESKPPQPLSKMPTIFPSSSTVNVIPWHESSPPPLPADDADDEFDEFNTSGPITTIPEDLLADDGLFKNQPPDSLQSETLPLPQPMFDSLSLHSLDDSLPNSMNSSQIDSNKIENVSPTICEQLSSPYREWSQVLTQILEILSNAADTFSNISNDSILEEVLESHEGSNHLRNLVEVYRVFKRIQLSYSMAVWNSAVQSQCEETEKSWKALMVHLKSKTSFIPNRSVFDFSSCVVNNGTSDKVCSICLLSVSLTSKDTFGVVKETILNVDKRKYHSTCANLWVNCVDSALPNIVLNN